jgi:hypothetical protein
MFNKTNSVDFPAVIIPAYQATDATDHVGYRPLLLSHATISKEATGASRGMLSNVAIESATPPDAVPVRKVDGGPD